MKARLARKSCARLAGPQATDSRNNIRLPKEHNLSGSNLFICLHQIICSLHLFHKNHILHTGQHAGSNIVICLRQILSALHLFDHWHFAHRTACLHTEPAFDATAVKSMKAWQGTHGVTDGEFLETNGARGNASHLEVRLSRTMPRQLF